MAIPFINFQRTRIPIVQMCIGGTLLNLIVDTGSDINYLDSRVFDKVKCKDTYKTTAGTITGSQNDNDGKPIYETIVNIDGRQYPTNVVFMDYSDVFKGIEQETGTQIHGMLGSIFLKIYGFIVDFEREKIYRT